MANLEGENQMNIEQWQTWLKSYTACEDGYNEASGKLPDEWYQTTQRGDWMIWVLRKIPKYRENRQLWVKIAIESAKLVVHLSKDPKQRPQKAIQAAENWLNNPNEENRKAAYAAADAAAYAAYAADATCPARAAAYAAYAADAAAYASTKNQIAGLVRGFVPTLVVELVENILPETLKTLN